MSARTDTEVIIGGKVLTVSGNESVEYLQKVAAYINSKINEYSKMDSFKRQPIDKQNMLIQLNIADDYFKAKAQVDKLERDVELRDKEIYDLKHDLISNQLKTESADDRIKELEAENRELLLNKARLEATLEDALLEGIGSKK